MEPILNRKLDSRKLLNAYQKSRSSCWLSESCILNASNCSWKCNADIANWNLHSSITYLKLKTPCVCEIQRSSKREVPNSTDVVCRNCKTKRTKNWWSSCKSRSRVRSHASWVVLERKDLWFCNILLLFEAVSWILQICLAVAVNLALKDWVHDGNLVLAQVWMELERKLLVRYAELDTIAIYGSTLFNVTTCRTFLRLCTVVCWKSLEVSLKHWAA